MENENELQNDSTFEEVVVSSGSTYLETINHNVVIGSLYITGALGIIAGILVGWAFHGIFRSK